MNTDDKMTMRDLDLDEGLFLLRYRLLPEEDKERFKKLMEDMNTNNSNEK